MPTQALSKQLTMINGFLIDVAISEEVSFESEVTEFPVEKGADITDNIRPKPLKVTIEGIVSNTPVNPDIIAARDAIDESVDEAYAVLTKVWEDGEPVDIRTSLRTYTSMAMQSLSIPRARGGGDALHFTASFQQVTIVDNTRTTRVAIPIAYKPKDVGGGTPKPAETTDGGPLYKVIGITRLGFFDQLWYDDAIGGWREGVVADHPRNSDTGEVDYSEGWVLYKGKPFGASTSQWLTVQSDAFWQSLIAADYEATKNSALGSDYDPFGSIHNNVISDVRLVHAFRR